MVSAMAEAAVERTIVLRSGGESLVMIDGRRAASRRVDVGGGVVIGFGLDEEDNGIVLPCGWTNELQLMATVSSRTERSLVEIIFRLLFVGKLVR